MGAVVLATYDGLYLNNPNSFDERRLWSDMLFLESFYVITAAVVVGGKSLTSGMIPCRFHDRGTKEARSFTAISTSFWMKFIYFGNSLQERSLTQISLFVVCRTVFSIYFISWSLTSIVCSRSLISELKPLTIFARRLGWVFSIVRMISSMRCIFCLR